jgi:signal transduction histidine kinase
MARLHPNRSVVTEFSLITAATLVLTGLAMYAVFHVAFFRVLEGKLQTETAALATGLSESLQTHIWNMDGETIRDFMERYPKPRGLERLQISSEFGDLIYGMHDGEHPDVLTHVQDVLKNGARIGTIRVDVSRYDIRLVQRAVGYTIMLTIAAGVLIILVAIILGQRYVVGRGLKRLLNGIGRISQGDYQYRLHGATHREFNELDLHINRMAGQIDERTETLRAEIVQREAAERNLQQLASSLEAEVESRTQALRKTNLKLKHEVMDRRTAEAEILKISGREQQRLGRDLHDSLGQQLVGISFLSQTLAKKIKLEMPVESDLAARIGELIQESVAQTRQMAHGLCPVGMLESGIEDALHELARTAEALFGVQCDVLCGDHIGLDTDAATHIYRISQEAISNARRHGQAKHIRIELKRSEDALHFSVQDDGLGIAATRSSNDGIGMRVMRSRAEALGRMLRIVNRSDAQGVVVSMQLPLPLPVPRKT